MCNTKVPSPTIEAVRVSQDRDEGVLLAEVMLNAELERALCLIRSLSRLIYAFARLFSIFSKMVSIDAYRQSEYKYT